MVPHNSYEPLPIAMQLYVSVLETQPELFFFLNEETIPATLKIGV